MFSYTMDKIVALHRTTSVVVVIVVDYNISERMTVEIQIH